VLVKKEFSRRKVYIYSPIPPIRSSSAVFLSIFFQELKAWLEGGDLELIVDGQSSEELGIPVRDVRALPEPIESSAIRIIFLANSALHRYCYRALKKPNQGATLAIVCEPLYDDMVFSQSELDSFHHTALKLVRHYTDKAQMAALSRADEVWMQDQVLGKVPELMTGFLKRVGKSQ
jgi:hypothetical protein